MKSSTTEIIERKFFSKEKLNVFLKKYLIIFILLAMIFLLQFYRRLSSSSATS